MGLPKEKRAYKQKPHALASKLAWLSLQGPLQSAFSCNAPSLSDEVVYITNTQHCKIITVIAKFSRIQHVAGVADVI